MTFTASELDPPLARWPDVAHVAEEEGVVALLPFLLTPLVRDPIFFRLENRLFDFRLPSRDELIDRT